MRDLTKSERRLMDAVVQYRRMHHVSPTYRELSGRIELSAARIVQIVRDLIEIGALQPRSGARSLVPTFEATAPTPDLEARELLRAARKILADTSRPDAQMMAERITRFLT